MGTRDGCVIWVLCTLSQIGRPGFEVKRIIWIRGMKKGRAQLVDRTNCHCSGSWELLGLDESGFITALYDSQFNLFT